jgi:hypothetical protein
MKTFKLSVIVTEKNRNYYIIQAATEQEAKDKFNYGAMPTSYEDPVSKDFIKIYLKTQWENTKY